MLGAVLGTIARALRSIWHAGIGEAETIQMRALLFKESNGLWCAQCLEHDIAVQADSESALISELVGVLSIYIELAIEKGEEPFSGMPPAPAHFFKMIESAQEIEEPIRVLDSSDAPTAPTIRFFHPVYS
jgi:hypothetical protein